MRIGKINTATFDYDIDFYKFLKISNELSKVFCLEDDVIINDVSELSETFAFNFKDIIDLSVLAHAAESDFGSILKLFKSKKKFKIKKFMERDFIIENLYSFVNFVYSSQNEYTRSDFICKLFKLKRYEKRLKKVTNSIRRAVIGNVVTHASMSYHIEKLVEAGYIITYERLYEILALWGRPSLRRRKKNPSRASLLRLINSEPKATPGRKPKFDATTLTKLLPLFLHKEHADLTKELSTMKVSRGQERNRKNMVKLLLKANKKTKIREFYFKNSIIPDYKVVVSKGFRPE